MVLRQIRCQRCGEVPLVLTCDLPQRLLVTGSTGFVGRHLMREIKGRVTVVAERRDIGAHTDWRSAFDGIDAVVHLAALAHGRASSSNYPTLRNVNALGSERLARAAAEAGVRHLIFISTNGVCGDETFGTPITEESPTAPRSPYATSKLEAERLVTAVSAGTGLRITILRPTLVYGPGNGGNMLRVLRLIDRGWPLPFAGIRNRRSLTHVGNLVSAIAAALLRPECEGTFVVCDDAVVSTPQLVRCLAEGMRRRARLFPFPQRLLRLGAAIVRQEDALRRLTGSFEADCGKLMNTFGWRPKITPQDGLYETGRWFRSGGEGEGWAKICR